MSDIERTLNETAAFIASGSVVLVLGQDTAAGARNIGNETVPELESAVHIFAKNKNINISFSSSADTLDYLTRNLASTRELKNYIRTCFSVTKTPPYLSAIPSIAWRRIYSFDISDAVELAYRQHQRKSQTLNSVTPFSSLTRSQATSSRVDLVKLYGDALSDSSECYATRSNFSQSVSATAWYNEFDSDINSRPTIFLAEETDSRFLYELFRSRMKKKSTQQIIFVAPNLASHQESILSEQGVVLIRLHSREFLTALTNVFPNGRSLEDIISDSAHVSIKNKYIQDSISTSFTVLTQNYFARALANAKPTGSIFGLYKGDQPKWSDVVKGVLADLTPYKNWRGRIDYHMRAARIGMHMFVLTSPAGMGKTLGLMSTAHWLRQRTKVPILWLEPDGDLKGFLMRLNDDDFADGVYVFIDDVMSHIESFDDIEEAQFRNVCFICTSRDTRWGKYKGRIPGFISVYEEPLRQINRLDAEEIYTQIERYGTTVYFDETHKDGRIKEIMRKSQRDMLVLVREIGQGHKFDKIVRSEISDLDAEQQFAYTLVCLTDRNQVPLPTDLFLHAIRDSLPHSDPQALADSLGRLVHYSEGRRTIRTRHATIASHIIERRSKVVDSAHIHQALKALLGAFAKYQTPIIVHHSNTGHARVFKTIINAKFLKDVLGIETALTIYEEKEKAFEKDGFYWQQYGLCRMQDGQYIEALRTLRHAYAVHNHFQIRHSLGAACLSACLNLGPAEMGDDFESVYEEGIRLLEDLHSEHGYKDELPITTLAQLDCRIANEHRSRSEYAKIMENHHRRLAFYIKDYPERDQARDIYQELNSALNGGADFGIMEIDFY